jgi:Uma2 family endonuclease
MQEVAFISERGFTQSEFWRWSRRLAPVALGKYELIDGRIVVTPPAGYPHGETDNLIATALGLAARGRGRAFGPSQGFELPTGDTVEPDASYISNERWRKGPRPQRGKFLRIVPDLAVELLSPESRTRDLGRKREIYAASGVREYWVVDLERKRILAFDLSRDPDSAARVLTAKQTLTTALLPKLRVRVGDLFPKP